MLYTIQKKKKTLYTLKKNPLTPRPALYLYFSTLPQPCSTPWPPSCSTLQTLSYFTSSTRTLPTPDFVPLNSKAAPRWDLPGQPVNQQGHTPSSHFFNRIITLNSLNTITSHCLSPLMRPKCPEGRDHRVPSISTLPGTRGRFKISICWRK